MFRARGVCQALVRFLFIICIDCLSDMYNKLHRNTSESESESESEFVQPPITVNIIVHTISTITIMAAIIDLLLFQQSVERNPGPKQSVDSFSIITYNTNGLGDKNKMKRLLTKLEPEVNKGGIVLLKKLT
jgi:hypothetical protein